jgi:hypothetical protein
MSSGGRGRASESRVHDSRKLECLPCGLGLRTAHLAKHRWWHPGPIAAATGGPHGRLWTGSARTRGVRGRAGPRNPMILSEAAVKLEAQSIRVAVGGSGPVPRAMLLGSRQGRKEHGKFDHPARPRYIGICGGGPRPHAPPQMACNHPSALTAVAEHEWALGRYCTRPLGCQSPTSRAPPAAPTVRHSARSQWPARGRQSRIHQCRRAKGRGWGGRGGLNWPRVELIFTAVSAAGPRPPHARHPHRPCPLSILPPPQQQCGRLGMALARGRKPADPGEGGGLGLGMACCIHAGGARGGGRARGGAPCDEGAQCRKG